MASDSEYPGVRLKFSAQVGQARIPIQIDIGFGDEGAAGETLWALL